jgi:hypothetical protein
VGVIAPAIRGGTLTPTIFQLYGGVPPAAVQEFEYGTPTSTGPVLDVQVAVKSVVAPLYNWVPVRGVTGVLSVAVTVKL